MSFRILCADECETIQTGVDRVARDCLCPVDKFVATIEDLQAAIQQEHFDVLITDLRLGSVNMIEFVAETKTHLPDLKAILYTSIPNVSLVAQAFAYQFHDVVFKVGSAEKLSRCLQALGTGKPPEGSPILKVKSFLELKLPEVFASVPVPLTKREQQVLIHLSLGLGNKEIALAIGISIETVKEHVQNILRKLSLNDRTAAAVWALRAGVPELDLHV